MQKCKENFFHKLVMSDHEYCLLGLIKFIYKIPKYANKNSAMDTTHTVIMSPIHLDLDRRQASSALDPCCVCLCIFPLELFHTS